METSTDDVVQATLALLGFPAHSSIRIYIFAKTETSSQMHYFSRSHCPEGNKHRIGYS